MSEKVSVLSKSWVRRLTYILPKSDEPCIALARLGCKDTNLFQPPVEKTVSPSTVYKSPYTDHTGSFEQQRKYLTQLALSLCQRHPKVQDRTVVSLRKQPCKHGKPKALKK